MRSQPVLQWTGVGWRSQHMQRARLKPLQARAYEGMTRSPAHVLQPDMLSNLSRTRPHSAGLTSVAMQMGAVERVSVPSDGPEQGSHCFVRGSYGQFWSNVCKPVNELGRTVS